MSKKFAVRGFGWKLAVAAAAVAGVASVSVAQPVSGGTSQDVASMSAGITIQNIAKIEVIPKNPTGEDLVLKGTATINDVPSATNFGSLGIVKVTTNSNKWDVAMTTRSGGRLLDTTSVVCQDTMRLDGWGNPTGIMDQDCAGSTPVYLQWDNGGTPANVVLQVAVGLAKSGQALGNTGAPSTIYPIISGLSGGTPAFIAPVSITPAKIIASDKGLTSPAPVDFAAELGNAGDAAGSAWGIFEDGIYGAGSTGGAVWGTIETLGFPIPKGNYEPQDEYFYVNVGIPEATYLALSGNSDGTYTEVFYFDLFANF
jgi:hypothetical protein